MRLFAHFVLVGALLTGCTKDPETDTQPDDTDPADTDREIAWVHRFTEAFAPARTGGVYLNFEPETSEEHVRAGFSGGKFERLAALKEQWDPDNLFSGNHNIAPRSST